jgi:hypothetical protein
MDAGRSRRDVLRMVGATGLALAGCAGESGGVDAGLDVGLPPEVDLLDASCDARLAVGTGLDQWTELPPIGAQTQAYRGGQGGYHLYGRVRFTGLAPDVYVMFWLFEEGRREALNYVARVRRRVDRGLVRAGDGWESAFAELVVLIADSSNITAFVARRFVLRVVVYEAGTATLRCASAEVPLAITRVIS